MDGDDDIPADRRRLDAEWLGATALREALGVGQHSTGGKDIPYLDVLEFGQQVAPRLFDPYHSVLAQAQEPRLAREYRRRAEAESALLHRNVTPIKLLTAEMEKLEQLMEARPARELNAVVARLRDALGWFEKWPYSEHKIVARDVLTARRIDLPQPTQQPNVYTDYVDYPLPYGQALRIRLLHPDRPEHATGADLLFEFCDQAERRARLALVQYKIWDGQVLRFSEAPGLAGQLQRMQRIACAAGICSSEHVEPLPAAYRFPCCAAFLRPTDRLQSPDANLVSSGMHVPACVAQSIPLGETGGRILRKDPLRSRALSQTAFEELFSRGMIGSNWISYNEVEQMYRDNNIFDATQRIVVHAQEFSTRAGAG